MTKIDQINDAFAIHSAKRPNAPASAPFSASLENALSGKVQGNVEKGGTSALSEPQPPILNQAGAISNPIVGQTDKLLGLLESYASSLENPCATLKELASIVDRMKDEAGQLMASTRIHSPEENDINGIAAKAALTANVEYIKFNRGDYI